MATLTGTGLLNFYLRNIEGTYSGDELQSMITAEGNVNLAYARGLEIEAARVAFSFSAGDVAADKSKYTGNLLKLASQVRSDQMAYPTDTSEMVSWSGSAEFGTAEVETYIDTEYGYPDF